MICTKVFTDAYGNVDLFRVKLLQNIAVGCYNLLGIIDSNEFRRMLPYIKS